MLEPPRSPEKCGASLPRMTFVTTSPQDLSPTVALSYHDLEMRLRMTWLTIVLRLASTPLFFGALIPVVRSYLAASGLEACVALLLLGAIQLLYWQQPWPMR